MEIRALLSVTAFLAVFGPSPHVQAQRSAVTLMLEQSTNRLGSWQSIPLTADMLKEGAITLNAEGQSIFYRLQVEVSGPPPSPGPMIAVEGGTLPLSSPSFPGATVSNFSLAKYETTYAEWVAVRTWALANGYDMAGFDVGQGSADNHPVRNICYFDAVKWCNARSEKEGLVPAYLVAGLNTVYRAGGSAILTWNTSANGYRLPSAAEWEWAAGGGKWSQGYIYSGSNDLNAVGWHRDNSSGASVDLWNGSGTWPIGQKAANELGFHDMSGNVAEFCFYDEPNNDPNGPEGEYFNALRGGGFNWYANQCAVGVRHVIGSLLVRYNFAGLRVARNVQ